MKMSDYKCNLCGEKLILVDELIGLKIDSKAEFFPANIEEADMHICGCCLSAIRLFSDKWDRRDDMTPAQKHAWGLCW